MLSIGFSVPALYLEPLFVIIKEEICIKLSDEELVRRSLVDMDYFLCLYERYEKRMLRYIQRISHVSAEQAQDILQEAFIKIWQNLHGFDQKLKLSSWIYRIVHNETISFWRKKKSFGKDQRVALSEHLIKESMEEFSLALEFDQKEVEVHKILEQLPIGYKTILLLKYFEGMSYQEISDVLKIPEGTVATQLNRAKKRFSELAAENKVAF